MNAYKEVIETVTEWLRHAAYTLMGVALVLGLMAFVVGVKS